MDLVTDFDYLLLRHAISIHLGGLRVALWLGPLESLLQDSAWLKPVSNLHSLLKHSVASPFTVSFTSWQMQSQCLTEDI